MVVSHAQTAFYGGRGKKGLAYYCYMSCAENRQIFAIVDWPLIGVDHLQRCSARMTYKVVYKVCRYASFKCL